MKRLVLMITLLASLGCGTNGSSSARSSSNTPPALADYNVRLRSESDRTRSELTFDLARIVCPKLVDDILCDASAVGEWNVQSLSVDLNSDGNTEHVLLFWESGDFYGFLCIMQRVADRWRVTYESLLQKRSYSPPTALVLHSEQEGKWLVCSFETNAHASGFHESRWMIVGMVSGRPRPVLNMMHEFQNYGMKFDSSIDACSQAGLVCSVRYAFFESSGATRGRLLFQGADSVSMKWDPLDKEFKPHFDGNKGLSRVRLQFLTTKKSIFDPAFGKIWQAELKESRM